MTLYGVDEFGAVPGASTVDLGSAWAWRRAGGVRQSPPV